MRKGLLIGCLLLVSWGVVATAGPEITVEQPDYNYGSIGLGYMVTSCGCTATELSTKHLAPGASVPLEVQVLADHGTTKNVSIYVHTNAPDIYGRTNDDRNDPDIILHVLGAITPKQDYEIAPFELADDMFLLIDVRDTDSYVANHLMGAINIPVDEIQTRMTSLSKSDYLIVYDLAGEAADAAVQTLLDAGYMSAYYLQRGISYWAEVHGDQYLVNAAPLPVASESIWGGSSGRPYNPDRLSTNFYVLIDLRDAGSYAAGHLAGAMNIPPAQLPQWFDRIPREANIILYDDDGSIPVAAYQTLRNAGFTFPGILLGGLNEWIYQYGTQHVMSE